MRNKQAKKIEVPHPKRHDVLASAVVLSWKRPWNIPVIAATLRAQTWIDDIVIWDNSGYWGSELEHAIWTQAFRLNVVWPGTNESCYGRFRAAVQSAKHDWIATQDDDCIVKNWHVIWENRADGRITANMHPERDGHVYEYPYGHGFDVWLGWGSVFQRQLIDLQKLEKYPRDADRVFAIMQASRHVSVYAQTLNLPGFDAPWAMHKEAEQEQLTHTARMHGKELALQKQR